MIPHLTNQRCIHHFSREAVARCPSCKRFFCRECVTEHDGRMMCGACVTAIDRAEESKQSGAQIGWFAMAGLGILVAWWIFYNLGLLLARMPSEFHANIFKGGWS